MSCNQAWKARNLRNQCHPLNWLMLTLKQLKYRMLRKLEIILISQNKLHKYQQLGKLKINKRKSQIVNNQYKLTKLSRNKTEFQVPSAIIVTLLIRKQNHQMLDSLITPRRSRINLLFKISNKYNKPMDNR